MDEDILNVGGKSDKLSVIVDPKHKRIETENNQMGLVNEEMVIDGPEITLGENMNGPDVSKNLIGAGSGFQARRVL